MWDLARSFHEDIIRKEKRGRIPEELDLGYGSGARDWPKLARSGPGGLAGLAPLLAEAKAAQRTYISMDTCCSLDLDCYCSEKKDRSLLAEFVVIFSC